MGNFDSFFGDIWRWRMQGPGGNPWVFFLIFLLASQQSLASEAASSGMHPYVPEKREYFLDIGSMWEEQSLYWAGGQIGFHTGRCMFSRSQTCQQFLDLIGGVGGRKGFTLGLALASVRWQFVNFPKPYSPSVQIFAGAMNIRDDARNTDQFTSGLGYAWTTAVHPRIDLKLQGRVGYAKQPWSQVFVSLGIKADQWVDYFGKRLRRLGTDTEGAVRSFFD